MAQRNASAAKSASAPATALVAAQPMANNPEDWSLYVIGAKFGDVKNALQTMESRLNELAVLTRKAIVRELGEGCTLKLYATQRKLEGWSDETQKFATPGFMAGLRSALHHVAESTFEQYYSKIRKVVIDPDGKFVFDRKPASRKRGESLPASLTLLAKGGGEFRWTEDADMRDVRAALAILNVSPQPADVAAFQKANPVLFAMLKDIAIG